MTLPPDTEEQRPPSLPCSSNTLAPALIAVLLIEYWRVRQLSHDYSRTPPGARRSASTSLRPSQRACLEFDPAAVVANARTEADDPSGVRHHRLMMLDDDDLEASSILRLELPPGLADEGCRPGTKKCLARSRADQAVDAIRKRFGETRWPMRRYQAGAVLSQTSSDA